MALPAHRITDNEEIVPPSMPFVTMNKRVLLVNKFYYTRGGAEVVAINLYDLLTQNGYDVYDDSRHADDSDERYNRQSREPVYGEGDQQRRKNRARSDYNELRVFPAVTA